MESQPFIEAFQELNGNFYRLLDSMSALRSLSSLRIYGQSEPELLASSLEMLVQNQDLERCSVYLLKGGKLVNEAGMDWDDLMGLRIHDSSVERDQYRSFAVGEGIVGMAAQTGVLQRCDDCTIDSRFARISSKDEASAIVGSLLSVPIKSNGELLGVLNVSYPHTHFFDQAHERTLVIFCNFLGQALLNNRLINQMEQQVHERTLQLEKTLAEAEKLKRRYAELSIIDELTGLHNRRFFFPEARAALSRALRNKLPFSLLLIDIDHFKRINDALGHTVGDEVLHQVAQVLAKQLREGDIIARFGGEEFIIALPFTELDGAKLLAKRVIKALDEIDWDLELEDKRVTVSIGISRLDVGDVNDSHQSLETLIKEADQALYHGKENGRDQCHAHPDLCSDQ